MAVARDISPDLVGVWISHATEHDSGYSGWEARNMDGVGIELQLFQSTRCQLKLDITEFVTE
jgi:hypothetical protein